MVLAHAHSTGDAVTLWTAGAAPKPARSVMGQRRRAGGTFPKPNPEAVFHNTFRPKGARPRNTAPPNLVTSAAVHFGEFLQEQQAPREYAFVIVKDNVIFLTQQLNLFAFSPQQTI